ncbi:hypothetical protein HF888_05160 [Bermanella marisrubri]|uniref:Outer membrane protein OmpA-like transmembrane domain-containing protein n=1 Tax=Bermanella marisrubri TaxID=207949 RepID=Q1N1V8_9GAMM|nr:hypothetical protein [Bermanella marisrubri]EAT12173.1 hypothetical protein RED65_04085 [Oceanobacter sp. RED65] [Bermanella marisrubri]QIZ83647.1 hypothetical protein HF888_05160 [Bermanella marisrubri]
MKNKLLNMLLRFFLIVLFTPSALAFPIEKYAGLAFGITSTEADFNDQVREFGNTREVPSYTNVDSSSNPFQIYFGFRFHPYYSAEISYIDYGSINFEKTLINESTTDSVTTRASNTLSVSGISLSHVLTYPLLDSLILQGKLGYLIGSISSTSDGTINTVNTSEGREQNTSFFNSSSSSLDTIQLAVGALYRVNANWLVRLQVNQLDFEIESQNEEYMQWFTSLSAEYEF